MFLITIFCVLKANSQPYLVTFTGTGASATVSTVKVENLTAGKSITLNGSDILRLTTATGVNSVEDNQLSDIKIYPNPMAGNSTLLISSPEAGNAIIRVTDMTSKMLTQIKSKLDKGLQEFHLSGQEGFWRMNLCEKNLTLALF